MRWYWIVLIVVAIILFAMEMGRVLRNHRREYTMRAEPPRAYGPWRWSQDGWVRVCKLTGHWDYGGEDYDGGPKT